MLIPALKLGFLQLSLGFGSSLPKMIFNMTVLMSDKAGGSVDTVSFLSECYNQGFSPFSWPFSCIQDLVAV